MAEVSDQPARPETIVVDLPLPGLLPTAGVLIAAAGLLLRSFARWLAWPVDWRPPGDPRGSPEWYYREALYAELGLVTLVFGLALVFLAIVRTTAPRPAEPAAAPDRGE